MPEPRRLAKSPGANKRRSGSASRRGTNLGPIKKHSVFWPFRALSRSGFHPPRFACILRNCKLRRAIDNKYFLGECQSGRRIMNFPFMGKGGDTGRACCTAQHDEESRPGPDVASLSMLPGVVLYQRVVTPEGQIHYTYISEGAHDLFGVSPEEIVSDPSALFG